jgi:hypothetical protein
MHIFPRSELRRKNEAQHYLIREMANAVPGFTEYDWDGSGYKAEFDRIWQRASDALKDDHEALLICVLSTTSKVAKIVDGKYAGPLDGDVPQGRIRM